MSHGKAQLELSIKLCFAIPKKNRANSSYYKNKLLKLVLFYWICQLGVVHILKPFFKPVLQQYKSKWNYIHSMVRKWLIDNFLFQNIAMDLDMNE